MRYSMENASMKVEVESLGTELKSVLGKKSNIEYMWCSNPEYYKRSAPNLFPIVGSLKDGVYHYQGKTYKMGQHGYVRDVEWKVEKKDENTLVFTHQSDDTTKEKYPFDYEMELIYHMNGNRLEITWNIKNTGKEKMCISRKLRYWDSGQQRRRMHRMQPLNLGLEDAIKRILTEVWKKGNGDMC